MLNFYYYYLSVQFPHPVKLIQNTQTSLPNLTSLSKQQHDSLANFTHTGVIITRQFLQIFFHQLYILLLLLLLLHTTYYILHTTHISLEPAPPHNLTALLSQHHPVHISHTSSTYTPSFFSLPYCHRVQTSHESRRPRTVRPVNTKSRPRIAHLFTSYIFLRHEAPRIDLAYITASRS